MFFKVCIAGYSVTASNASELKYYFGRLVMTKSNEQTYMNRCQTTLICTKKETMSA